LGSVLDLADQQGEVCALERLVEGAGRVAGDMTAVSRDGFETCPFLRVVRFGCERHGAVGEPL